MRGTQGKRPAALAGLAAVSAATALGAAGCGGERQDANVPGGTFKVRIVSASFPAKQDLAERSKLVIKVRNEDTKTVPNVAVTVQTKARGASGGAPEAFMTEIDDPRLADTGRPVWIVDQPPQGGQTASTNTWALGPLKPGATRTFKWRLTAVRSGRYTIEYSVAPALYKARAASGSGAGRFHVQVSGEPANVRFSDSGKVVRTPPE